MLDARTIPTFNAQDVLSQVSFDSDDKCWEWNGYITKYGYGVYGHMGYMVHRIIYELLVDKLGTEESIDHLCKNKKCVNPNHLEVVSLRENVLRSNNFYAINARKSYCKHGHIFDDDNTYIHPKRGTRHCKKCNKLAQQRFNIKKED
jgi:hypothetical protein